MAVAMLLAANLVGPPPAQAVGPVEIQVPIQVATIQGAIDAAATGDTVVVAPGTVRSDGRAEPTVARSGRTQRVGPHPVAGPQPLVRIYCRSRCRIDWRGEPGG